MTAPIRPPSTQRPAGGGAANGLRPGTVFLLLGLVLVLVSARVAQVALAADGEQPRNLRRLPVLPVSFDLCDAGGTPMAGTAEGLELVLSPNAMWQAHTPEVIVTRIAAALGPSASAGELFERMMPPALENGWIVCGEDRLALDAAAAARVQAWIAGGVVDPERPAVPPQGFQLVQGSQPGTYRLAWCPAVVLSEAERARQGFERPRDWTRHIAEALLAARDGVAAGADERDEKERAEARDAIWLALLPCQFRVVTKDVPPSAASAIHAILKDERVQPLQMEMRRNLRRVYPVQGRQGGASPPVAVLGRWTTFTAEAARKSAVRRLGLAEDSARWTEEERAELSELVDSLVYQPSPTSGLELLSWNLLERPEFGWVGRRGEEYTFSQNRAPRRPLQRYFRELVPGDPVPRVITTIDLALQRRMRALLEDIVEKHQPALAQAIAVDVATGDVLAVDAIDVYGMGGFAPTMHTFTPGSTFKVVVMASALDEGVVTPDQRFDSKNGKFTIEGRAIGEAEGGDDKGVVSAAYGLAYSLNAVLVQIGTRVPAAALRQHIVDLGYADYPRSGLGGERKGLLTPLPWKTKYTHASVSFGHEILVTLWQHAAALATVVRGGHYRPLRLVQAVEWNGRREEIPLVEDHPLQVHDSLSRRACEEVRDMMRLGALEGTGRIVTKPIQDLVDVGTKTGTAQKVGNELCLHLELQHNLEHGCRGAKACRAELLRTGKPPHRNCYTSSICAFGRRKDGGREVLVLVVVDEPRGRRHFGSEVAGPAGIGILQEALGLTHEGLAPLELDAQGFHALQEAAALDVVDEDGSDQPWAEDARAPR